MKKLLMTAASVAGCGFLVLTGQPVAPPTVYTANQVAAGRMAYRSSCGKCHTDTLAGRKGEVGEAPALSSLPAEMQEVVRAAGGQVPPLIGADFMSEWGTTRDLSSRIKTAVGGFPPADLSDETYLNLTAYILQANGARPGAQSLTAATAVEIRSLTGQASAK